MDLNALQAEQGAVFAPDQIPLHFGDQLAEYRAALENVILLDRSHEARMEMTGSSALDLIQRISTNDVATLVEGQGRPTVFTNAIARILDRIEVFRQTDKLFILGGPGRSTPLRAYLQRNIFFGDDARVQDAAPSTRQFDLHGPAAQTIIKAAAPDAADLNIYEGRATTIADAPVYIMRRPPITEQHWTIVVPTEQAAAIWTALTEAGAQPAGSLIYNVLRVRAGLPSVGRELSEQYIPLEVGLWDAVSFSKGCYTGQEIIARMESRNRLAKTLVAIQLDARVDVPAAVYVDGRSVGQLTSSVTAPDGEIFALAVVKPDYAEAGQPLTIGDDHVAAQVKAAPEAIRRQIR